MLERAAIAADRGPIGRQHLPSEFGHAPVVDNLELSGLRFPVGTTVEAAERELIMQTLEATNQNKTRAAELLGISLKTSAQQVEGVRNESPACGSALKRNSRSRRRWWCCSSSRWFRGFMSGELGAPGDPRHRTSARASWPIKRSVASAQALAESAERGETLNSDSAADLREYVQHSLDNSSALNSLLESAIGYAPTIYEITITDQSRKALVSSDAKQRGRQIPVYPNASLLIMRVSSSNCAFCMARPKFIR